MAYAMAPAARAEQSRYRPIIAAVIGNALEWYDFAVYIYLASVVAEVFFPKTLGDVSLLYSFATLGVGYLARPAGGIVIGYLGDKLGRKWALSFTIVMMGLTTLLIGLLPTYASIGIAAPVLLTLLRLIQGFAVGGEWSGSVLFIVEYTPPERRGFMGSWQQVTVVVGQLLGSASVAVLTTLLTHDELLSYGWRIPFLVGVLVAGLGLYLRARVDDTPEFLAAQQADASSHSTRSVSMVPAIPNMFRVVGITALWSTNFAFTLTYIPSFLKQAGFSLQNGLAFATLANILVAVLIPFAGLLADKYPRPRIVAIAAILTAVLAYPATAIMSTGNVVGVFASIIVFAGIIALISGSGPALLSELFPVRIRYGALSISYAIAAACFAGFGPFIMALLVQRTGSQISIAYYVIAAGLVGLFAAATIPKGDST